MPLHCGVTEKRTGGAGTDNVGDLQQIWPTHSLSSVHVCAQVAAHRPLQQSSVDPVPAQSDEAVHALGHGWMTGLTQRPFTLRFGSSACTVEQQISPLVVLHCESSVQDAGHCVAWVQMGWE